jgi:uncharacterized protein (TIGR02444 family)
MSNVQPQILSASDEALPLDNAFWRFSLAVYRGDGVATECLALQESRGIDVNLLLYCAWVGSLGLVLVERELAAAARLTEDWHNAVVRTLRSTRQQIKTMRGAAAFEPFRNRVKRLELESEQIEQALLFSAAPAASTRGPVARAEAIAANIALYLDGASAPHVTAASLALPN